VSSTAGRCIHWDGQCAVSEDGAAPGAITLRQHRVLSDSYQFIYLLIHCNFINRRYTQINVGITFILY